MRKMSQMRKLAEGRGTGTQGDYRPWIKISELNSCGTCSSYRDPIHGRNVQLLSQGEFRAYLKIRFYDTVQDIREQYPLADLARSIEIANRLGYKHPMDGADPAIMTTDLLVTRTDGSLVACSCKPCMEDLTERDIEKLLIEKTYWNDVNVKWVLIETDRISHTLAKNIMDAFEYYDIDRVHDAQSLVKHMVAVKRIVTDMETPIDWIALGRKEGLI